MSPQPTQIRCPLAAAGDETPPSVGDAAAENRVDRLEAD